MQSITKSSSAAPAASISRNIFEDLFRIGGVLRRRWRLVAVANLVFLTLAMFYLVQTKTVYKASARLLVIQQGERPINVGNGPSPFGHLPSQQDTLSTHLLVIRSPLIVGRALEQSQLNHLSIDSVITNMKVVQPPGGGKVVDLEYQAESEEEARKLMEACIASYDQFLKDNFQKDTRDVITLIGKARDELSKELKELEHAYLEFRKQNPSLSGSSEGHSFAARPRTVGSGRQRGPCAALQLRTQMQLAKRLTKEGVGTSVISAALNQLGGVAAAGSATLPEAAAPRAEPVADDHTLDGGTYEQIADQLADVEYRRRSTERLIEHFRSQQAALAQEKPLDQKDVAFAFYADPDVAHRLEELEEARSRHQSTTRVARNAWDPAVAVHRSQVKKLEEAIAQLWREKKRPSSKVCATIKKTKRSGNQKLTW